VNGRTPTFQRPGNDHEVHEELEELTSSFVNFVIVVAFVVQATVTMTFPRA